MKDKPTCLSELARELRLTQKQKRFAEALAADPNSNQTKAALAAGSTPKKAVESGSRWARSGKVRAYIQAIVGEMLGRADGRVLADIHEALATLTAQMREERCWRRIDDHGRIYEPGKAASKLLDYLAPTGPIEDNRTLVINCAGEAPTPDELCAAFKRMLREGRSDAGGRVA